MDLQIIWRLFVQTIWWLNLVLKLYNYINIIQLFIYKLKNELFSVTKVIIYLLTVYTMKYLLLKIWRTNNPFCSRKHLLIKEYARAFKYTNYYTEVLEIHKIVVYNSYS